MSHNQDVGHVGKAGWFAAGALAASVGFMLLLVAGNIFEAAATGSDVEAPMPELVIEAK